MCVYPLAEDDRVVQNVTPGFKVVGINRFTRLIRVIMVIKLLGYHDDVLKQALRVVRGS